MDIANNQDEEYLFQQINTYTPCLPPGTENMGLPVFGVFELKIGKLINFETTTNFNNIKVKPVFWGENGTSYLLRATNTCLADGDISQTTGLYAIRYDNKMSCISIQKVS